MSSLIQLIREITRRLVFPRKPAMKLKRNYI